jgi:hypothetical protein
MSALGQKQTLQRLLAMSALSPKTEAGFQVDRLETGYMRGPKPMTFIYEGSARPM